ncbi:MAG: phage tail tape measure protein, partial [Gammaproteobacteria bacterium HGW-Gammaproteobacteria-8]
MALAGDEGSKGQAKAQRDWERSQKRVAALTERLARQQEQTKKVGDALKKTGVDTRDLSAANERLGATIDQQTAAFLKQKEVIESREKYRQGFVQEAAKLGSAIILTKKATSAAMDFESAMAEVRKVVDFDSAAQMRDMGNEIQRMASYLGLSAVEIAQIVAAGGQANIARSELTAFADDAGKMGVAFDIAAGEAGQMMAQWRAGLELTQDGVRELADQINYLGNTGPAKASKIAAIVTSI